MNPTFFSGPARPQCPLRPSLKARYHLAVWGFAAVGLCSGMTVETRSSGRLVAWGWTVVPYIETATRFTEVACGDGHTLALRSDGTVVA